MLAYLNTTFGLSPPGPAGTSIGYENEAAPVNACTCQPCREGRKAEWLAPLPDLLLLVEADGIPQFPGLRRQSRAPLICLAANNDPAHIVALLAAGADLVLPLPLNTSLLQAQIQATLRRSCVRCVGQHPAAAGRTQQIGDLRLDWATYQASRAGSPLELTRSQWRLLGLLCRHIPQVLSYEQIGGTLWPDAAEPVVGTLHSLVRQLRARLGSPDLIENVHGVGYRLREPAREWYQEFDGIAPDSSLNLP